MSVSVICTGFDKDEKSPPEDFEIENGVLKKYKGSDSTVVVPEGVTYIEKQVFSIYKPINEIYIPASVTHISEDSFFISFYVEKIIYAGTEAQWQELEKSNKTSFRNITVQCTDGILQNKTYF